MYFIFDYWIGAYIKSLETKEDVVRWFSKHDPNYKNLNVTGNDCSINFSDYDTDYFGFNIRRFQVFDKKGRSIDPRVWNIAPSGTPAEGLDWDWGLSTGKKRNRRRIKGLSLCLRSQKALTKIPEDIEIQIAQDKSAIRKKTCPSSNQVWENSERKYQQKFHRIECWKTQTKNPRQWGKQKPRFTKNALERLLKDVFPEE